MTLERSHSGTTTDLFYNHITAELKPINGAQVSTYTTHDMWGMPRARSDHPSEQECLQRRREDWSNTFNKEDLNAKYSIFCIKTAEGDPGFLFIEPNFGKKPISYYFYTYTWVRRSSRSEVLVFDDGASRLIAPPASNSFDPSCTVMRRCARRGCGGARSPSPLGAAPSSRGGAAPARPARWWGTAPPCAGLPAARCASPLGQR